MPDWKNLIRARVAPLAGLDAARDTDIVDELAQHVAEHYAELGGFCGMALGATRSGIRLMVVARASGITAIGVAIGIALSVFTGRMLSTLLFDVQPFDVPTIAATSLIVLATGAAAAYIPARRASSVDPLTVIRGE